MAHFETKESIPDVRRHLRKTPIQEFIAYAKKLLFLGDSEKTG